MGGRRGHRYARRRCCVRVVVAASLCLLGLGPAGTAEAHASIEEIVPSDGALLTRAPDAVTIRFTEAITEQFAGAQLVATETDGVDSAGSDGVREVELIAQP